MKKISKTSILLSFTTLIIMLLPSRPHGNDQNQKKSITWPIFVSFASNRSSSHERNCFYCKKALFGFHHLYYSNHFFGDDFSDQTRETNGNVSSTNQ